MRKIALLIICILLLSACAGSSSGEQKGGSASAGKITVQDAWARPAKAGATSAIYFVVDNGGEADTMLGVECGAAMMAEMHKTTTDENNKSSMMQQENVPLPGGEKTEFKPGGLHIMLMKLKNDLEPGQKVPFTLRFEKAGEVQLEAVVREP